MTQPGCRLPRRDLAHPGFAVGLLGLGTVKFGRNEEVKYPEAFPLPSLEALTTLLAEAKGYGINLLDTAPAYGLAEERVGELAGQDPYWRIATKVGEGFAEGRSFYDFGEAAIEASLRQSQARLRRRPLDLVLLHCDPEDREALRSRALETLRRWQRRGEILLIGASPRTLEGAKGFLDAGVDVLMLTSNPTDRSQEPVFAEAAARGVAILVKKALASGHLGLGRAEEREEGLRRAAALPGVASVVVGTLSPSHLRANVAALVCPDSGRTQGKLHD